MRADAAKWEAALRTWRCDPVALDVMMPGEDGLSAARRLAAEGTPRILMPSAMA